jgi:HD superfamily phosphohydrolase
MTDFGIDALLTSLQPMYRRTATLQKAWESEHLQLRQILPSILKDLSHTYEEPHPIGIGGSGVVFRIRDKWLGVSRALKVARPVAGKQELLAGLLKEETDKLVRLAHPNLIRVFGRGTVEIAGVTAPYYVMEYIEDVQDSADYFATHQVTDASFVSILEKVLAAVAYIHGAGEVHMDLKPANVLITPMGQPVISDLGFAKVMKTDSGYTLIGGTEGYIHPGARKYLVETEDEDRLRGEAPRREIRPNWDLYSLGRTVLAYLAQVEGREDRALTPYTHRYLKLLACRLLDGENGLDDTLLGIAVKSYSELRYASASEAHDDILKLTGNYDIGRRVPELNPYTPDTIQASTLATTPFTRRVSDLLALSELKTLGNFSQLGLLYLIYPTATHTRLEHTIGTFAMLVRYINALYNDPLNPIFRQVMSERDINAALVASLVHDIGHYGLAHDLEEAESEVFDHEERTRHLLRTSSELRSLITARAAEEETPGSHWDVSAERVIAILSAQPRTLEGSLRDRMLHALINGPLDADKLDYLVRDSQNLGLPYGRVIDVERLLRCLTIVTKVMGQETYATLGIHEKGRVTAEAVAFARYALYGSVYWHHAYRAVKAMLHRMVWEYLRDLDVADSRRHEGIVKSARATLYDFLIPTASSGPQLNLIAGPSVPPSTAMSSGDGAVLEWLGSHSGDVGREMVRLISERHLFKRLVAVSREKRAEGDTLWPLIGRVLGRNEWRLRLDIETQFQQRVLEAVERAPGPDAPSAFVTTDARNRFLVEGAQHVLLLVDYPADRSGGRSGLEYLLEEDRRRLKIDELAIATMERSTVWDALRDNFRDSIGKARVYCHPDHHRFLSAYLDRRRIEDALELTLRHFES